jgi:hypothetical protein
MVFVCLFVCFESHEQFFSSLATVTITGDRAANLDLWLALTAFSIEASFTCHTYCDTGPPFLRSYPKDPWFSLLNAVFLAKEQSVSGLTRPVRAGLELTTSRLLSESTSYRNWCTCLGGNSIFMNYYGIGCKVDDISTALKTRQNFRISINRRSATVIKFAFKIQNIDCMVGRSILFTLVKNYSIT